MRICKLIIVFFAVFLLFQTVYPAELEGNNEWTNKRWERKEDPEKDKNEKQLQKKKKKEREQLFYVVVNIENEIESINKNLLMNIYLGKVTLWSDEIRILPSMLTERQKPIKVFIELVVDKSVSQYRVYWKRRLFSGGGTVPKTYKKDKQVLSYVSKKGGAIGIVSKKVKKEGVKYIRIKM